MKKIITFLVCIAVFFQLFTPIKAYISGGEALSMLLPVAVIFFYDKMFVRKQFIWVAIVVIIYLLLYFMGVEYFNNVIPKCIILLFAVLGIEHYFITKDEFYVKWVIVTFYATLFFLIIISIPQFIIMPNLTRIMAKAAEDPTIEMQYYWTISYGTIHNLPVLSIPIFACFKTFKTWGKIIAIIGLAIMMFVMVLASSSTSLILLVLTYFFFIFYNSKKTFSKNVIRLVVLAMFLVPLMSTSVQLAMFDLVQPAFEGSNTTHKIDEIKYYIEYGETSGDMEAREDLYQVTIDGILSNPILPEKDINKIGQHTYLLDHLSAMGLFFFIPYVCFIFSRFKRVYNKIPSFRLYTTVSFVSLIILASFKNFFVITSSLFIVPLFLALLENKSKSL